MKKKKRGGGDFNHHRYIVYDGDHHHHPICVTAMDLLRRVLVMIMMRRRHRLFPLVSALTAFSLLVFAAFSFLHFPPPVHPNYQHHHHRLLASHQAGNGVVPESTSREETVFRVPINGGSLEGDLWSSKFSSFYYGCSNATSSFPKADAKTRPDRYLLIATSGGLNQQRTGITDAVVAAYILNATLVIPKLDANSFWKDDSEFGDVFDVEWFISTLSKDVSIIKQLPTKGGKTMTPHRTRVPRKCTPKCYESRVLPLLNKKHAVLLGKFDYRLSNRLDIELQKLRCRVNYHGLKFTDPIREMGKLLVQRMRMRSRHFIALHLRFEPDMLAFSGCYYGGGEKERAELGTIRKRWRTLHTSNPEKERRHGRCPLTPEEVGLMLRAMGFGADVHVYVASGEVYGGEETLAPLKALFPNIHSKDTLASKKELEPFSSFSSRMAALDFIVCDKSDVFVTNNNGNMAKILAGRRRYFGHKPTIRPNGKKLYKLFMTKDNTTWEEFASKVRKSQIGFMGEPNEVKPGRGEFHENPEACICERSNANGKGDVDLQGYKELERRDKTGKEVGSNQNESEEPWTEEEHEQETQDVDYLDNGNGVQDNNLSAAGSLDGFFSD